VVTMPLVRCRACGVEDNSAVELPGLHFTFLDGEPFVCDRCVAKVFGIAADWKPVIRQNLS